jgi:putative ABC transport system permease protein
MSEAFWRTRFNGDPTIVGRELRLDGSLWTVVGIVPKDFQLVAPSSLWAMRPFVNMPPRVRAIQLLSAVGRMKPGISMQAAEADLSSVAAALAREFPQATGPRRAVNRCTAIIGSDLRLTSMFLRCRSC